MSTIDKSLTSLTLHSLHLESWSLERREWRSVNPLRFKLCLPVRPISQLQVHQDIVHQEPRKTFHYNNRYHSRVDLAKNEIVAISAWLMLLQPKSHHLIMIHN